MDSSKQEALEHHGRPVMLVLSRQLNEAIVVSDDIRITILQISGDKVKLGIEAPASVSVHRAEIHRRIYEECLSAKLVASN